MKSIEKRHEFLSHVDNFKDHSNPQPLQQLRIAIRNGDVQTAKKIIDSSSGHVFDNTEKTRNLLCALENQQKEILRLFMNEGHKYYRYKR